MSGLDRLVYVISDLHVGGEAPDAATGSPGFQMCSHTEALASFVRSIAEQPASGPARELVINGDFVDFLSEADPEAIDSERPWTPLRTRQAPAVAALETIMGRTPSLFAALGALLARGHRLTLILGNHDVELSYPAARAALERRIDPDGRGNLRYVIDGEAYVVGDAIIEHGNRYDPANVVDHGALRRFRSFASRREDVPSRYLPSAPVGSELVASTMNPLKSKYRFIDLLKPEDEAVFPLIAALEPGLRWKVLPILTQLAKVATHLHLPGFGPLRSGEIGAVEEGDDDLDAAVDVLIAPEKRAQYRAALAGPSAQGTGEIGFRESWNKASGMAELLLLPPRQRDERLRVVLKAIRCLQDDRSFELGLETSTRYLKAAERLSLAGEGEAPFRWVVLGHTHHARDFELPSHPARYLNSGTWADLMRFPREIVVGEEEEALPALIQFAERVARNDLAPYLWFRPTCVRLGLRGARVVEGATIELDPATPVAT